jgi:hypothetical protein
VNRTINSKVSEMRLRYTLLFTLFFLVGPAKAAPQSDRQRDGLQGPARSIVLQHALLYNRNGKVEEGSRSDVEAAEYNIQGKRIRDQLLLGRCGMVLPYITTYDSSGRVRTERTLFPALWPFITIIHHYDSAGNATETDWYNSWHGLPAAKAIYQYEFDSYGNWVTKTELVLDVKFNHGDASFVPRQRDYRIIHYGN